jgi:hypothetical protein
MGFQAILADGSVIAPAVDVLDGLLKPSQANAKYKGITGMCPHCQELRDAQAGTDNIQVQQALSIADLSVSFKRAYLDGERMVRVMHFAHRAGFLSSPGACLLCRDNQLAHHAAAVKVIGRWAERHWPGCTVKAEMQIIIPGAPPVQFRPDVSVICATGNRVACIEYQRSKESFEAFKARDELRCSEFGEVLWFFRTGAYGSSLDHRDYLADRSRRFFKAFTDPETERLQYEPGKRPVRREHRGSDHSLEACSESSLLRAIDPPERSRSGERLGINTSLEMQEVQRAERIRPGRLSPEQIWAERDQKMKELIALRNAADRKRRQDEADRYQPLSPELRARIDERLARLKQEAADNRAFDAAERRRREKERDDLRKSEEQKKEDQRKALETPLGRILDARKRGIAPSVNDRIQHAIDNRNWTPTDIQRWDHSQGFGVILRLKQIDDYLKRGRK